MSYMLPPNEVLATVIDDLLYIRDGWGEQISDGELRRGSAVLRRLLIHGELQRAWKAAGNKSQPTVPAVLLPELPFSVVEFASAGGAQFNGMQVSAVFSAKPGTRLPDKLKEQLSALSKAGELVRNLRLSEFLSASCLVVDGVPVSRRQLVTFVANKLGGAHYDPSRDDKDGPFFRLLDKARTVWTVSDKPAVYLEVLAVGQALSRSADLARLCGLAAPIVY